MSEAIRVAIVDDHQMFAESLSRLVGAEEGFEVVGVAASGADAVPLVASTRPGVALVDFRLPDASGADVAAGILTSSPRTRVLMLTGSDEHGALARAIEAGCAGFLTKDRAFDELVHAIRVVASGECYIPARLLATLLPRVRRDASEPTTELTARELGILALLRDGVTSREIAASEFLSIHTVRNHIQSILSKLGAHSQLQAVAIATRQHLFDEA